MKNLTIALMAAAAFTSVGCKKKGGGAGEAMTKMTEFSDKMCACKDKKCADGVQDEMTKWSQDMAKNAGDKKPEPMSEDDTKKYSEATTKFSTCAQKAMSAGGDMTGSGSAAAGSGSATAGSAAAPAADAPKVGEGPVVTAKTLFMIDMPPVPNTSDKANWSPAYAEKDGDRLINLMEGDKMFVSVQFADCNRPMVKDLKADERGVYGYCFTNPAADAAKVGKYPRMDKADDVIVAIKVGHVIVTAGVAEGPAKGKVTKDDLAKWLATADLSSLEK